ncbi:hypothetical protein EHO59_01855 [Leptospira semungkisensis]|uniref:Uncharacterized protein n=1 Tax=Leptospira semungkisensis TaxID=2484985 RepID=A0A4R9G665_9LEPT|nr:hypothetical protein [Leptospira semungkisensis]TGK06891.1 hypothetical protein EHO59_01855 [Leptospira semungkisensis]
MCELPFTISLHEGFGDSHLDLFLDIDGISRLITFGTVASNWPLLQNGTSIPFQRKKDHRRDYLDLEGEIEGKGRLRILFRGSAKAYSIPENVSGWTELTASIKDGTLTL